MNVYLVGGAVRDKLLGKEPKDLDFVVVGATVEEFKHEFPDANQIGKSFPVFETTYDGRRVEIAFARRERKTGLGHQGFDVVADPSVSLIEDLARRDFTMNAMAISVENDHLIDPFGGEQDIKDKLIRHVGPAFNEDPLRVYRCGRFSAQLGFGIPKETVAMCRSIPRSEFSALSGERVGNEVRKSIMGKYPEQFWRFLRAVGNPAFDTWFPELVQLVGTPAGPPGHHDELDAFVHTLMVLNYLVYTLGEKHAVATEEARFAALLHDLGKGATDPALWPKHHGHEEAGVPLVARFCERLKLPNSVRDSAMLASREHLKVHKFLDLRKGKMVDLIRAADRTPLKAEGLAAVAFADAMGREAIVKSVAGPTALITAADAAREETGQPIPASLQGEHIGLYIRNKKGNAILRAFKKEVADPSCD